MNVYRVLKEETVGVGEVDITYARTFSEAKELAKNAVVVLNPSEYVVELIKIKTDSESIVKLLNGSSPDATILRTWEITKRRGLKELKE